ncbi:MAG: hypothetical protein H7Z76_02580 [Methylotenera sp.]|nr:hypothetical protein [Flavobacterium sp.]
MKNKVVLLLLFLLSLSSNAQPTLTLEDCYALADTKYPMEKHTALLQQKSVYEVAALTKGILPKIV